MGDQRTTPERLATRMLAAIAAPVHTDIGTGERARVVRKEFALGDQRFDLRITNVTTEPLSSERDLETLNGALDSLLVQQARALSAESRVADLQVLASLMMVKDTARYCELVPEDGVRPRNKGGCPEKVTAARLEDGFLDYVCALHAEKAESRGATVVWAPR